MIGIYKITNIKNNKCYIGLSKNIEGRLKGHKNKLLNGKHKNQHLQTSFNKYGLDSFTFSILEECSEELLCLREKYWIEKLKSYDKKYGYNKTHGGEFGKLSDEIIQNITEKLRNRKLPDEMKKQISKTLTGRKQSPETVKKRVNSIRKIDIETEKLVVKLYIEDGLTRPQIQEKLNIKLSLVQGGN